ncbi:response regulator [Tuberibacillus sp. Marseille-P3662]|uniref:response regulator n=1 Tax=Tuberibacillus sp. Marseille-P3662 TaxID=1965358 RepID=UPI000A1CBC4D|nr:response regulator transcription factor [Tuberibacillus sp. Marseille-P3662]
MAIKIVLVDDHLIVLKGLRFFLESQNDINIVGEAEDGETAIQIVADVQPDIVLMDLQMPKMDGIEATKALKNQYPNVKVIVLTSFSDYDHVLPAIKAGAFGYQLKDVDPDELVNVIRDAYQGKSKLHSEAAHLLLNYFSDQAPQEDNQLIEQLTSREKDVLQQIALGKSNKEIANALFITEKTVKTHVSHLLGKLGLHDRTQAAIYAMKQELFT